MRKQVFGVKVLCFLPYSDLQYLSSMSYPSCQHCQGSDWADFISGNIAILANLHCVSNNGKVCR